MWQILLFLLSAESSLYSPEQVHLAWTDSPTSMSVTWASEVQSYSASVQYTPISSHSDHVTSYAYSSAGIWTSFPNMAESRILQRQLNVCKAYMTGLIRGQLYAYRVGSATFGWSEQFSFQAFRNFTENPSVRLLVYGDLGVGPQIVPSIERLVEETNTYQYDAVIHNGDFAYDMDDDHGQRGDLFLRSIEPVASRLPYMISQGNHESGYILPHYTNRFQMPGNSSNLWYSFNAGRAHFIAYNTEPLFDDLNQTQAEQMVFIQEDLESYDKQMYPWLIVFGHRPLYCSANMSSSVFTDVPLSRNNADCRQHADLLKNVFEELWYNYHADLVITGHVHAYERLGPVYQNASVPCEQGSNNTCIGAAAPIYMVTGVPGQDDAYSPVSPTPLPFSMAQDDNRGYSRLSIFNETHLFWEQVRSVTYEVSDYLWLIKGSGKAKLVDK